MNQTRTQRIHRGFHRVGVSLAGIALAGGLILTGAIIANETSAEPIRLARVDALFGSVAVALSLYVTSRAIGWIIAGFTGD